MNRMASRSPSADPAASLPASGYRGCTNLRLRRFTRRISREYDAIVAAAGLKTTQYSLLSHIHHMGPMRLTALAAELGVDASTLTRNLQPLVAQGWVEQQAGEDARSRQVTLTPAGRAKRSEGQRAWKQAQLSLNNRLGAERVMRLHDLIDECMAILDEANAEPTDD